MNCTWKRLENEKGVPFYYNEATNTKQWDHPKFADIKQRLDDCNYIKYAVYRVASKFRVLQQTLFMDEVPLTVITSIFEIHKLGSTEGSLYLETYDLEAILSDIYFAANKRYHTNIDIDFATDLMINFLYNIYDSNREGKVQVSSTKILLAILSNCKVLDFYNFLFSQCSDHNYCVTPLRLQMVLAKIADIISYLHEDASYGHYLISSSVDSCFSNSPGFIGINKGAFIQWLENYPQLLAWITILYRMRTSEGVIHNAKCTVCKTSPIVGLHYKCVKCINHTQCQHCFFAARCTNTHKLNHAMKEYCLEVRSKDLSQIILKKISRMLKCSKSNQSVFNSELIEAKLLSSNKNKLIKTENNLNISSNKTCPLFSPQAQLQNIIGELEIQTRELQQILIVNNCSDKDLKKYLEEHRSHVTQQIQKLKTLKEYLQTVQPTLVNQRTMLNGCVFESTPAVPKLRHIPQKQQTLNFLSPIPQITGSTASADVSKEALEAMTLENNNTQCSSLEQYSVKDISTWIGGSPKPSNSSNYYTEIPSGEMNNDLDDVLAKLQQILANNFILDEDLDKADSEQLQHAVTEVETMLTTFRDGFENNRKT